jgi:16S rRNA (adenine1518-N6/adenine1519-N6)-dimethyltransferase
MTPRPASELPAIDFGMFGRVVAAAFNQRRKILRNALGEFASEASFAAAGVDPLARAETLAVDDFVRLTRAVPGPGATAER